MMLQPVMYSSMWFYVKSKKTYSRQLECSNTQKGLGTPFYTVCSSSNIEHDVKFTIFASEKQYTLQLRPLCHRFLILVKQFLQTKSQKRTFLSHSLQRSKNMLKARRRRTTNILDFFPPEATFFPSFYDWRRNKGQIWEKEEGEMAPNYYDKKVQ